VTLRARLTAAFLAVVLGPVLLGAVFIGTTVPAIGADRAHERLTLASGAVRAEIGARCQRLAAAATSAALLARDDPTPAERRTSAGTGAGRASVRHEALAALDVGFAATIMLTGPDGDIQATAGAPPPATWVDCASPGRGVGTSIAATVERRDTAGTDLGAAVAIAPVDDALAQALARIGGVSVTVLSTGDALLSTESRAEARAVRRAASLHEDGTTGSGRYVRRVDAGPGQPLRLALAVDPPTSGTLYAVLVLVVVAAAVLAMVAAWWLARSTTRPLTELAYAADRVAAGDLGTKVPVRSVDEVGRLAMTFNRMTQEMRGYIRALTASRDQLRGYLALLGDTLSGTHDLSRILHVTLHTARAATAAQAGVVLLYDPASKLLVAQSAIGSLPDSDVDLAGLRLKLGEGLLGAIAESGVPERGRFGDSTPLAPHEPRADTYIAVPFAAPAVTEGEEAARGLLVLYDRVGPEEFDVGDLVTLTTFAGQAAVALDNVRLHEEAQRLSLTDPLTGLFNYRYLRESLRRELERANRFNRTLAVVALDLDHFKHVNDRYGHGAGDAVLAELARRIRGVTREVDFAFRRGGEEFVILLPETDAAGGAALARRLGSAVRRTPVNTRNGPVTVTVSIGVAVHPTHGTTGSAVLEAADMALYAAKAAGRDTCRIAIAPGAACGPQPTRRGSGG
jgi:two-component system cell cycle response regulator